MVPLAVGCILRSVNSDLCSLVSMENVNFSPSFSMEKEMESCFPLGLPLYRRGPKCSMVTNSSCILNLNRWVGKAGKERLHYWNFLLLIDRNHCRTGFECSFHRWIRLLSRERRRRVVRKHRVHRNLKASFSRNWFLCSYDKHMCSHLPLIKFPG